MNSLEQRFNTTLDRMNAESQDDYNAWLESDLPYRIERSEAARRALPPAVGHVLSDDFLFECLRLVNTKSLMFRGCFLLEADMAILTTYGPSPILNDNEVHHLPVSHRYNGTPIFLTKAPFPPGDAPNGFDTPEAKDRIDQLAAEGVLVKPFVEHGFRYLDIDFRPLWERRLATADAVAQTKVERAKRPPVATYIRLIIGLAFIAVLGWMGWALTQWVIQYEVTLPLAPVLASAVAISLKTLSILVIVGIYVSICLAMIDPLGFEIWAYHRDLEVDVAGSRKTGHLAFRKRSRTSRLEVSDKKVS